MQYLSLARDYAREGGTLATIRCHFEGRCKEDIRHPLYQFLLAAVVDDQPASFARAKLVTFATALLLLAVVYWIVRRRFGPEPAWIAVVLLSFSATLMGMSASLVHDVLFDTLIFAAVYAIVEWQGRPWPYWLGIGALIGCAYLTKGNGYVVFVPLVAAGLWRERLEPFLFLGPRSVLLELGWSAKRL